MSAENTLQIEMVGRIVRALRPHQWVKNLLLFIPIAMAHRLDDTAGLKRVLFGMIAFSLAASAGYVLNGLLDLPFDRKHPTKSKRVFASGELPAKAGWILVPLLYVRRRPSPGRLAHLSPPISRHM